MIDKIRLWWKFDGRYYHKNFIYGVKNLWKWFPVIWEDRDWDQDFIYEILIHKLEKQATYFHHSEYSARAKREAEKMFLCAKLARIQQEELYGGEYTDYCDIEYEFIPTDETKQWFEMKDTTISENYDEYFAKYPRQYKRVLNGEDELSRYRKDGEKIDPTDKHMIAMYIAHENQNRSRKLLFKILEQNIERWWD